MSKNVEAARVLDRCLTVGELREMLDGYDAECKVFFTCDYGDYSHTQQALPVNSVDEKPARDLVDSAYSHSRVALVGGDDEELYWCEHCEEEYPMPKCPNCGSRCIMADGSPAPEEDAEESLPVIVLSM